MNKLLKARQRLVQNSKKGFTLVELIVVIVILAILIAALTPAILGVINRANVSADQADVRSVMMAGSVVGMTFNPPRAPAQTSTEIALFRDEFTGGVNVQPGTYTIYFDGAVAVGGILSGSHARSGSQVQVGAMQGTGSTTYQTVTFDIPTGGGAFTPNPTHLTPNS